MSSVPRILIVDDEVDTCDNLSDILTDIGFEVEVAQDGYKALELAEHHAFDIALLDLRMPGMDGLDLYQRLRKISASTVVIVVTAYASSSTAESILNAGAWKLISKPVNTALLIKLVKDSSPII